MKDYSGSPDFECLRKVLYGGKADHVPLIDLFHDIEIKTGLLGRELFTLEDDIEFYMKAGYDYYGFLMEFDFYGDKWPGKLDKFDIIKAKNIDRSKKSISRTYKGVIDTLEAAEKHSWPKIQDMDFSKAEKASKLIPSGARLIPWTRGIFETVNEMVGYENYCIMLYEEPELLEFLHDRVGELKIQLFNNLAEINNVGALWIGDDLGYTEGLLFPPSFMEKLLFPYYRKLGEICRKKNIPLILHSDGRLYEIIDSLIDCGFNAIHPLEPKAMDPLKLQEMYGGKLGLLGNIDLDILSRGSPDEIRKMVRNNMEKLGSKGGYAIGASNSVPYYVPVENFIAMIDEVKKQ